jgi:radical SAM protein with 4Fe4S-binding SPASM domain
MYDEPTYQGEIQNSLSTEDCYEVVDHFVSMVDRLSEDCRRFGTVVKPRIAFSGGDPLLREDFFEILSYASKKNISVGIMGNPEKVTTAVASRMKELSVDSYQISIDGMQKTHDQIRREGSFKESLKAIRVLKEVGIQDIVMFTLSKFNADDLIPVINLAAQEKVSRFAFARISSMGEAKKINKPFRSHEYRALLLSVHKEIKKLKALGAKARFDYKDPLWNPLRHELGQYKLRGNGYPKRIYDGCHAGRTFLALLADGTIYACRRFQSPIGHVKRENLYNVFRYSKTLNKIRNPNAFQKCGSCELRSYCRGCPAVAFHACGSFLGPDPQCWKNIPFNERVAF